MQKKMVEKHCCDGTGIRLFQHEILVPFKKGSDFLIQLRCLLFFWFILVDPDIVLLRYNLYTIKPSQSV